MVNTTEIFKAPIEKIFAVLEDYESYSQFMDGVKKVTILEENGDEAVVEYSINMIKKFKYELYLKKTAPTKIEWNFKEGDIFAKNSGSWTFKDLGDGTTEVNYIVDVEFKVKVPGMISKKLISSNLPSLMKAVEKRANSL